MSNSSSKPVESQTPHCASEPMPPLKHQLGNLTWQQVKDGARRYNVNGTMADIERQTFSADLK